MASRPAPATTTQTTALAAAEEALLRGTGIEIARQETVVNGIRLHYLTCGEGPPLLLLHGRGSAAARFAPVLPLLAAERRVIALDLPGWGLSDKPPFTGHSATDALTFWADAVRGFLDDQGLDQIDLLGHSMGGFTALGVALAAPERVGRLVLVDPGGLGTRVQLDLRLFYALGPERLQRIFGARLTRYIFARETRQPDAADANLEFAFLRALATQAEVIPSGAKAFNAWVSLTGVHLTLTDRLAELPMPVLLLWGVRDQITPYADALHAARHLRDGTFVTFVRCGHAPFAERPADFAQVLLTWLKGIHVRSRA
ncbi:MAG: alpha/beta fold hydrolase [Ktedonobacterales bacterium]